MHQTYPPQTALSGRKALIIGGGVAGPALAVFLQRAGIAATVYEARSAAEEDAGFFLNLGPNGVNVLKTLGLDIQSEADGSPIRGMAFFNGSGRRIARIDASDEEARYGARSLMMKRSRLHKALRDEAVRRGIAVEHGKKLTDIEVVERPDRNGEQHEQSSDRGADGGRQVVAHFEDGSPARGDFLVGCDGLHSRTRQLILPDAPGPAYSGFVDCGGFSSPAQALPGVGTFQMTFGRRAFFGQIGRPNGEVWWFSNVAWPDEPARGELAAISDTDWQRRLLELHGGDHPPIPTVIRSTPGEIGRWGAYELPSLPTWHQGPVCLVGDAAHAGPPHLGQGASTALEDALVLAKCLRDIPDLEQAFATYEGLRRERVEKIVAAARRNGQQKAIANPVAAFIRDLLLPVFIKLSGGGTDWIYSYRLNWETPIADRTPGPRHTETGRLTPSANRGGR